MTSRRRKRKKRGEMRDWVGLFYIPPAPPPPLGSDPPLHSLSYISIIRTYSTGPGIFPRELQMWPSRFRFSRIFYVGGGSTTAKFNFFIKIKKIVYLPIGEKSGFFFQNHFDIGVGTQGEWDIRHRLLSFFWPARVQIMSHYLDFRFGGLIFW